MIKNIRHHDKSLVINVLNSGGSLKEATRKRPTLNVTVTVTANYTVNTYSGYFLARPLVSCVAIPILNNKEKDIFGRWIHIDVINHSSAIALWYYLVMDWIDWPVGIYDPGQVSVGKWFGRSRPGPKLKIPYRHCLVWQEIICDVCEVTTRKLSST